MGLGTKAYLVGAILTFYSSFAAALGLGEITLNSALNQPLDAEIELLHVRDLTEREIIVGLASHEEFARAGVDRTYLLQNLNFRVDLSAPEGPIIRVTSQKPVREPFINFLLSAQWPSGKLLREYTLLVDLPVFSGTKAAPVQAAKREQPSRVEPTRVEPTRTPRESATPSPGRVSTGPAYAGEEYGPVGANENLWSIASKVRPDSSVTVQQTMLALQRLNPEAFINGNINLLRRGQVLRVPEKDDIQSLSQREAVNQVADQNRQWSQKTRPQDESSAQLEGSKRFSPTRTESSSPEGRVKLSSGEKVSAAENGTGAGEESGTRAVESQLAATQEELDAASRENADLKSRLSSVDEQIETMEKLVEVTSAEMRALELAAQQTNEATPEPEVTPEAESEPVVEGEAVDPVVEQESSQQSSDPVQANQPEQSWLDKLIGLVKDNILSVAIVLGVLVAGIIVLLIMKRRRDDSFDDEFDDDFSVDYDNEYEPALVAAASEDDDHSRAVGDRRDTEYDSKTELSTEAETEDVVGECDIHIAYGQYEQAEEKLYRALEKEPANIAMRLKLLEVFAAQSDLASFDNHFAKIHTLGDQEAIDRAAMLREGIDDAEPFDLSAHDTAQFERSLAGGYQSSDNEVAKFNSEASIDDEFTADDTLDFDFAAADEGVVSSGLGASITDDSDELELDLSDLDVSSMDDYEDDTVIPIKGDKSAALHREIDSSLDALDETFEINDSEIGTTDGDYSLSDVTSGKSNDALGDLEFDLDDIDADMSFDDVELDLESDGFDGLGDDDRTQVAGNTFDLPEDDASELTVRAPNASARDADAGFDFDESTFEFDEAQPNERAKTAQEGLDFDLDRDLESAIADDSSVGATGSATLDDMDFGDFDSLDIDDEQIDGGEATEFELADDNDLGLASNLAGAPLTGDADEDEPESIVEALSVAEAKQDDSSDDLGGFDFDGDVGLDDLDKELDSLTSDFEGSLASADALMDEPITDLEDDFNFDEPGEDSTETAAQKAEIATDANTRPAEPSIGDSDSDLDLDLDEEPVASNDSSKELADDQSLDFEIPDFDPENDDDSNLDFLSDNDETATKLDLARAYIDMGDADGAKDILDEIAEEGNEQQKHEAETLLSRLA